MITAISLLYQEKSMDFKCISTRAGKCPAHEREWTGQAEIVFQTADTIKLIIHGRGSRMDTIIGRYRIGLYVCIPDINVGCPISSMSDFFWNRERLSEQMNQTDAVTVAWVLKAAASCWGIFKNA